MAASPSVGFAIGTYGMKPMETVDALRLIAKTGYDGVSIAMMTGWKCDPAKLPPSEARTIGKALADLGLKLAALNDQLPLVGTPEKRAWNLERIRLAAGFVHGLGTGAKPSCLDTMLGLKTADWDSAKSRMADELHEWARVAEAEDLTIGIKPHAAQAMDTPEKALWMMDQLRSPRIRLVYDYSHMRVAGLPLESTVRQLVPRSAFISIKDATGNPDKFEFLLPGAGDTDYLRYFRLLRDVRYDGFVSVEVSAMVQRQPGYDPVRATELCYRKIAPYFTQAGLKRPSR